MSRWVVDASVAMKWCLPSTAEESIPRRLACEFKPTGCELAQFVVPDLFWLELANGLWKAVWKETMDQPWAERAHAKIADLAIPTASSFGFVPQALQLAEQYQRTVYDSIYVALARKHGRGTRDRGRALANVMAARFPVTWLGAL